MARTRVWLAGAVLALFASTVAAATNAAPLDETWRAAEIWTPPQASGFFRTDMTDLTAHETMTRAGLKLPTVLFLHGCTAGRKPAGWTMARHLARAGYAVILPDSFAGTGRKETCDRWSFAPIPISDVERARILEQRRAELDLALVRARALPWVDAANLFVMAYDEGADALAAWDGNGGARGGVRGRVLISTLCPEGLAGGTLATLTIGGTDDPLLAGQSPSACAIKGPTEQKNFETPFHDLTGLATARDEIMAFLSRNRTSAP